MIMYSEYFSRLFKNKFALTDKYHEQLHKTRIARNLPVSTMRRIILVNGADKRQVCGKTRKLSKKARRIYPRGKAWLQVQRNTFGG